MNIIIFTIYFFQFLYEWKSKTKKKARTYKASINQTGGGAYTSTELSDLENKLMGVLGWIHVIGCPGLPEEIEPGQDEHEEREEIVIDENIFLDGRILEQTEITETEADVGSEGFLVLPPLQKKK